jgi:hypothetical protein
MPPRFAYWTIIAGGQPTAFRAAMRDELLPTLKQLQSKEPDAVLMWFSRGKLWPSQEAAWMAQRMEREGSSGRQRRGADWRPGGQHKDPRDRFKVPRDVKRERFAANRRRDRIEEQGRDGDRPLGPRDRPAGERQFRPKTGAGAARPSRPAGPRGPGRGQPGGSFRGGGNRGGRGGGGRGSR